MEIGATNVDSFFFLTLMLVADDIERNFLKIKLNIELVRAHIMVQLVLPWFNQMI